MQLFTQKSLLHVKSQKSVLNHECYRYREFGYVRTCVNNIRPLLACFWLHRKLWLGLRYAYCRRHVLFIFIRQFMISSRYRASRRVQGYLRSVSCLSSSCTCGVQLVRASNVVGKTLFFRIGGSLAKQRSQLVANTLIYLLNRLLDLQVVNIRVIAAFE